MISLSLILHLTKILEKKLPRWYYRISKAIRVRVPRFGVIFIWRLRNSSPVDGIHGMGRFSHYLMNPGSNHAFFFRRSSLVQQMLGHLLQLMSVLQKAVHEHDTGVTKRCIHRPPHQDSLARHRNLSRYRTRSTARLRSMSLLRRQVCALPDTTQDPGCLPPGRCRRQAHRGAFSIGSGCSSSNRYLLSND